jgi:hypothetical protein
MLAHAQCHPRGRWSDVRAPWGRSPGAGLDPLSSWNNGNRRGRRFYRQHSRGIGDDQSHLTTNQLAGLLRAL